MTHLGMKCVVSLPKSHFAIERIIKITKKISDEFIRESFVINFVKVK